MADNNRYSPLKDYLTVKRNESTKIRVAFSEIEERLGFELPPDARVSRSWWKNQRDAVDFHTNSWLDAGLIVITVKFNEEWVEFLKVG